MAYLAHTERKKQWVGQQDTAHWVLGFRLDGTSNDASLAAPIVPTIGSAKLSTDAVRRDQQQATLITIPRVKLINYPFLYTVAQL